MPRDRYMGTGKLRKVTVRAAEGGRVSSKRKSYRVRSGTRNQLVERVFTDNAGARRHASSSLLDLQVYCQRHNKAGLDQIAGARSSIDLWNGDAPRDIEVLYDERMPPFVIILDRV